MCFDWLLAVCVNAHISGVYMRLHWLTECTGEGPAPEREDGGPITTQNAGIPGWRSDPPSAPLRSTRGQRGGCTSKSDFAYTGSRIHRPARMVKNNSI